MSAKQISVADLERVQDKAIDDYSWKFYHNDSVGLCSLCGNSGIIDTRTTAISGAGVNAGRLNYCICLNGKAMRKEKWPLEQSLVNQRLAAAAFAAVQKVNNELS